MFIVIFYSHVHLYHCNSLLYVKQNLSDNSNLTTVVNDLSLDKGNLLCYISLLHFVEAFMYIWNDNKALIVNICVSVLITWVWSSCSLGHCCCCSCCLLLLTGLGIHVMCSWNLNTGLQQDKGLLQDYHQSVCLYNFHFFF